MSNLKADAPEPTDVEGMFEDAAYWNRYDQTTPWGGVRWNDDRTAMTQYLSPEMQELMGMQMGMYGGALSQMMAWFGMDPNAFDSFGMEPGDVGDGGGPIRPDPEDPDTWPPGWYFDENGWHTRKENDDYDPDLAKARRYGIPRDDDSGGGGGGDDDRTLIRRPDGRKIPIDPDDLFPPEDDWLNEDPYEPNVTGGPWNSWGNTRPEMFFSEDIPSLLWEMDWDAIPDLPTLDQFDEDRDRITQEMYTQGLGLLDPYLQQQEGKQRQGLADRGIPISAEIGRAEMGDFNRMRGRSLGDLSFASTMGGYDEAARQFGLGLGAYSTGLQGEMSRLGMQNQARGQAWNERMGVRTQQYNELASLLGMSMMPSQQMGYNFNPSIDTMGGYGMEYGRNQFNSGLFNQWMSDIFGSIQGF